MSEEKIVKKESRVMSEAELKMETLTVKEKLARQPKRTVRLQPEKDPKKPNYETVMINGYGFQIMKGKEVQVPQSVYDILVESGII